MLARRLGVESTPAAFVKTAFETILGTSAIGGRTSRRRTISATATGSARVAEGFRRRLSSALDRTLFMSCSTTMIS